MFSSTLGPSPFHSTLYSPGGNCLPCTSTLSYRCSVPLLVPAAKALAASSSDAPAKVTRFLDPFIFAPFLIALAKIPATVAGALAAPLVGCEGRAAVTPKDLM